MESREPVRHVVCVDHLDAAAIGFQEALQFMGVVIEGIVGRCDDERARRRAFEPLREGNARTSWSRGVSPERNWASTTSFRRS